MSRSSRSDNRNGPDPIYRPQPAWMGPPDDVQPGVAPIELLLGRSPTTAMFLLGMHAYPVGIAMTIALRVHGPTPLAMEVSGLDRLSRELFGEHRFGYKPRPGRLEWGFVLADGRRVANTDERPHPGPGVDFCTWLPDRPVLQGGGGGASGRSVDTTYWLWPLPPPGPLRVFCQWPDRGIALVEHELDAAPLLEAAARSRPLWPD